MLHNDSLRPVSRSDAFTLIEMLVVVAIISVLAAILLPSLSKARQRGEMTSCLGNMRQVFIATASFQADNEAMTPAFGYAHHPNGITSKDVVGTGSKFGYDMNLAAVMLTEGGYANNGVLRYNPTWAQLAEASRDSVFACPSGWTPTSNANDGLNEMTDEQRRRAMVLAKVQDRNTLNCGECGQWKGSVDTKKRMMTAYVINNNAGSWSWYHNTKYNRGFYKRSNWDSSPEKVGYIAENNSYWFEENHMETMWSFTKNSWSLSGVKYGPSARHMGLKESNLIYADGHAGTMGDLYNTRNDFPFKWY